jgi:2,3-bisphosphoglycerate-dependent phosphoglycerate mutase
MNATRIIAVRHGETDWNVATRIQGQLDIGLNSRGHWQADQAGAALSGETIDAIHSSDLWRAFDTALAIAKPHGLQVTTVEGLRERGFGVFEGKTFKEIELAWPEQSLQWRRREPSFAPEGGESLLDFRDRVLACAEQIAARHLGQSIVMVGHGGVMDVLYRAAAHLAVDAARSWSLDNAAINRLLWSPDSGFALVGWNDARHLESPLDEQTAA